MCICPEDLEITYFRALGNSVCLARNMSEPVSKKSGVDGCRVFEQMMACGRTAGNRRDLGFAYKHFFHPVCRYDVQCGRLLAK